MENFYKFFEKAQILMEGPPFHIEGDYNAASYNDENEKPGNYISIRSLSAAYTHMADIKIPALSETLSLYHRDYPMGVRVIIGVIPYKSDYQVCIFSMKLETISLPIVGESHCVTNVQTEQNYRHSHIAFLIYLFLVTELGLVVSDQYQFDGAIALWKRLASLSDEYDMCVRVLDIDTRKFITGDDGSIEYDGKNIPDDVIWGQDHARHTRIRLILSKK